MSDDALIDISPLITEELRIRDAFYAERHFEPWRFHPFLLPCINRVLLVADGGLDFSEADFGLGCSSEPFSTPPAAMSAMRSRWPTSARAI